MNTATIFPSLSKRLEQAQALTFFWAMGFEVPYLIEMPRWDYMPPLFIHKKQNKKPIIKKEEKRIYGLSYNQLLKRNGIKVPRSWWDFNHPKGNGRTKLKYE